MNGSRNSGKTDSRREKRRYPKTSPTRLLKRQRGGNTKVSDEGQIALGNPQKRLSGETLGDCNKEAGKTWRPSYDILMWMRDIVAVESESQ